MRGELREELPDHIQGGGFLRDGEKMPHSKEEDLQWSRSPTMQKRVGVILFNQVSQLGWPCLRIDYILKNIFLLDERANWFLEASVIRSAMPVIAAGSVFRTAAGGNWHSEFGSALHCPPVINRLCCPALGKITFCQPAFLSSHSNPLFQVLGAEPGQVCG